MVTWGANQVFTFSSNASNSGAPPTPAFGSSPAPAGGGLFGSAPAPAGGGGFFGNAPAPSSTGFFGSSPSPAAGGLFGNVSAPAGGGLFGKSTSGSLFGGTSNPPPAGGGIFGSSAPASGGSLFGAPAPSSGGLFGAPTPSGGSLFGAPAPSSGGLFGAPAPSSGGLFGGPPQQPSAPAIPAQAALQAHMDASARQEAAKLQAALEDLHHAYAGTSHQKPSPLVTIVYNTMSSEQLQWQFANQQAGGGYVLPPKPPQVDEQKWLEAVVNNPDRSSYIPVALVGAEALQARVGWQQQQATGYEQNINMLKGAQEDMQRRTAQVRQSVDQLEQMHATLRSRLLRIMNKVEVVRCMNLPLQADEVNLVKRLQGILQQIELLNKTLSKLQGTNAAPLPKNLELPDRQRLQQVLTEHRSSIIYLSEAVQQEKRDIHLIKERVANR
jgi:Nucleoporin complex subunit 54/Nucleoporin FG repeat region